MVRVHGRWIPKTTQQRTEGNIHGGRGRGGRYTQLKAVRNSQKSHVDCKGREILLLLE
jgi:hypothetical protein